MQKMRKIKRQLSPVDARAILEKGEYGVLSMVSDGRGYGVPISYAYKNDKIYLHCAREGEKLNALRENNLVSFTVVGDTKINPEKFSTTYESTIVHGKVTFAEGEEKKAGLFALIEKYSPDFLESGSAYIEKSGMATEVIVIDIEVITGKASR